MKHYDGSKLHKLIHEVCDLLNERGAEPADGLFVAANLLSNADDFYGTVRAHEIFEKAYQILKEQQTGETAVSE